MNIEDSGKRIKYKTGALRDTEEGKVRYDLLPPECLRRVWLGERNEDHLSATIFNLFGIMYNEEKGHKTE